jgi:hypothetical protein
VRLLLVYNPESRELRIKKAQELRESGHSLSHIATVFGTNNYNVGLLLKGDIPDDYASFQIGMALGKAGLSVFEFRHEYLSYIMRTRKLKSTQAALKFWTDLTNRERVSLTQEVLADLEQRISAEIADSRKLHGS